MIEPDAGGASSVDSSEEIIIFGADDPEDYLSTIHSSG